MRRTSYLSFKNTRLPKSTRLPFWSVKLITS